MNCWSRQETLVLISLYKERPSLYDSKHEDYTKKYIRRQKIMEICIGMQKIKPNITPAAIKNKIKTLLNQLSKERLKIRRRSASGQVYHPVLWCFRELSFLFNVENNGRDTSRCVDSEDSDTNLGTNASINKTSNRQEGNNSKSNPKSNGVKSLELPPKDQYTKKPNVTSFSGSELLSDIKKTMEIAKSLHINSQQKSKEDAFAEFLALELQELKFEENYECAVKTILQRVYDIKHKERRLHYEAARRNTFAENILSQPVNEPSSSSCPPVQILTLKENIAPAANNTNGNTTDCEIISDDEDVVIKLEGDE